MTISNENLENPVVEAIYVDWNIHGTRKNGEGFIITEPTGQGPHYETFHGICEFCCRLVEGEKDLCPHHPNAKIIPIHDEADEVAEHDDYSDMYSDWSDGPI